MKTYFAVKLQKEILIRVSELHASILCATDI